MKLTDHQEEVLANMAFWEREWVRPMDVGGHNGSHHSETLRALVAKGLVESRWRTGPGGKWARGSKTYRLSESALSIAKAAEEGRTDRLLELLGRLAARA